MSWDSYWKDKGSKAEEKKLKTVHPVWRGIGFLMIVLIPIFSFALADLLIKLAPGTVPNFFLPDELRGAVEVPLYGVVNNFKAVLAFTAVLSVLMFAVFGVINAAIYQLLGGSPADRLDAPAEKYNKRKKLK